ncbi:peptidase [Actinoplanes utahensis]|uniref:Peptidase n=1 Tax=Actinoplanes utahensis TaxID=1869 RepID=A0A0A6URZ0_ACTUT|nr:peptidase [Actinoplanes utahensis]
MFASSPAAAAAAAPVNATTVPVAQAAAAAKVTPKQTVYTASRNIPWGSTLKVTTKVINPKTGKIAKGNVSFQAWSNGAWRTWSTKASTNGWVTFTVKPTSNVLFRTLFAGSGYNWKLSPNTRVTVRASGAKVLAEAKRHKGALYLYGASGPNRFDCSGFTKYVYKKAAGKSLPHKANLQQKYGTGIAKNKKQIGDLIVFRSGSYGSHVGIYAGNGYVYDSPHSGARVGLHKIWNNNYVVRRLVA